MKSKQTIMLHQFPFYREPLELHERDASVITDVLGDRGSYDLKMPGIMKACGGFHPDYAVEWTSGGDVYHGLVCLGCHEILIHGPQGQQHFDIKDGLQGVEPYQRLKRVLAEYRKNRPLGEMARLVMIDRLREGSSEEKRSMIAALERVRVADALLFVPALVDAAIDSDPQVQTAARKALNRIAPGAIK
jgi:hypothetical protein